jgi:hypothetical protein
MRPDPQRPASPPSEGPQEEEPRALLLRLLRLVAAKVAEELRRGETPAQAERRPGKKPDPQAQIEDKGL